MQSRSKNKQEVKPQATSQKRGTATSNTNATSYTNHHATYKHAKGTQSDMYHLRRLPIAKDLVGCAIKGDVASSILQVILFSLCVFIFNLHAIKRRYVIPLHAWTAGMSACAVVVIPPRKAVTKASWNTLQYQTHLSC